MTDDAPLEPRAARAVLFAVLWAGRAGDAIRIGIFASALLASALGVQIFLAYRSGS